MPSPFPTTDEGIPVNYGDPVTVSFFDGIQDFTGTLGRLDLTLANATTVRSLAGPGAAKVGVGIGGALRWNTANTDVAMPGGAEAGRYTIYVTTGPYTIAGVNDTTDYSFGLAIVKEGAAAPSTTYKKIVGYLDWSGTAITRLVQTFVRRDDSPHAAVSPTGTVPALEANMPSGATANPLQASVGGVPVLTVSPAGAITATGAISAVAATLSRNDRTALVLPGIQAGITFGPETQLYRIGTNVLATSGSLAAGGYLQAMQHAFIGGILTFGAFGGGSLDTTLERAASNTLRTGGALQVGGNVSLTTNAGALIFGSAADTNLYRSAPGILRSDGSLTLTGALAVGGPLTHTGSVIGLFGATAVARSTGWGSITPPGGTLKALTYSASMRDIIDYVLTLSRDLQTYGLLGV